MLRIFNVKKLHGYSIVKEARNVSINHHNIKKLAKEYDAIGYMSEDVGYELDSLYDDPDYK